MNEWLVNGTELCYNSPSAGFAVSTSNVHQPGGLYVISFTISNMTMGKVVLDSIVGKPEFIANGDYQVIGVATSNNLTFVGDLYLNLVFNGCLDNIESRSVPLITIKDLDGNVVFQQTDETGVTSSLNNVQYDVSWQPLEYPNCYKIYFTDSGLDYESDCLFIDLNHDCSLLLSWTNTDNAYLFNYEDLDFEPKLRVNAKLWQPSYKKEKLVFKDNSGTRYILKSETSKEELLTVREVPKYIHDALSIGLEHDNFYVDSVRYVNDETEYTPKWRKSSDLAPVEVVLVQDQNLKNSNC